MEYSCSLASAQAFAAGGRLEEWVHAYLLSHGNNRAFSEGLRRCPRCFMGPFRLPRGWFTRCCGPEPGMKYPVEAAGFWRHVEELAAAIQAGEDLPPLIANYAGGVFELNDGNHRLEALTRLGAAECNVIVWCTGEEDRRAFLAVYARYKAQQR